MVTRQTVIGINIAVYSIIGIVHFLRILFGWEARIEAWQAPVGVSIIAVVIAGVLIYLNWKHVMKK